MKRAIAVIVLAVLASMMLVTAAFANANPTTECGDNPKYNKYQIGDDGSVGALESNVGTVITLTASNAAERIYDYANTNTADWTLFRIVLKHGHSGDDVINDPAQSGTVDARSDISHITFCLKAADTPPPEENGPEETGSTEVQGSNQTQESQVTAVLGVQLERPAPAATAEAQAAMLTATGVEDEWLAVAAIGLIITGAVILRRVPVRSAVWDHSS